MRALLVYFTKANLPNILPMITNFSSLFKLFSIPDYSLHLDLTNRLKTDRMFLLAVLFVAALAEETVPPTTTSFVTPTPYVIGEYHRLVILSTF